MLSLREMDVTTEIDSTMFDSGDDEDDDSASEIDDATDSSDVDEEVDVDEKEGADASVMRKFSQINVSDEIEKGKAVKAQLSKVLSVCFNYKRVTAPRFILYVIVFFFFLLNIQVCGTVCWNAASRCRNFFYWQINFRSTTLGVSSLKNLMNHFIPPLKNVSYSFLAFLVLPVFTLRYRDACLFNN